MRIAGTGADMHLLYEEKNGSQIMATLHFLSINGLRLEEIWSITEGIAALIHDIKVLDSAQAGTQSHWYEGWFTDHYLCRNDAKSF